MNKEIKEILEKIKSVSNFDDYVDFVGTEFKSLLDYINDLEKEIKELKEAVDRLTNKEYKKDDSHLGIVRTKEQLERMQYLLCFKSKVEITDILIDKEEKIDKAKAKLQTMFDNGDEDTVLDDLLKLDEILGSDKE